MLLIIEMLFIVLLAMILFMTYMSEHASSKNLIPRAKAEEYWSDANRRRHFRFTKTLEVDYMVEKKPTFRKNGKTVDISEGGMKLLLDEKLAAGAILRLAVVMPNSRKVAEAEGEVVWSEDSAEKSASGKRLFYSGIKFSAIKEPAKTHFMDYIRSLIVKSEA